MLTESNPAPPLVLLPLSPLSLARTAWERKISIALGTAILAGIGIAVAWKLPGVYRAEALVLVDSQKIPEQYVASSVNAEIRDRLATLSQRILSATRLQKIIDSNDLYREERKKLTREEVVEKMRKDIDIHLEKGWTRDRPGAFRVVYEGHNPASTAEVANQITSLFIEENLRAREVHAEGTAEFIESELQEARKKLDEVETQVSKFKLEHNGELPQQENSLIASLNALQIELQGNQDAIARAQQNKLMIENALGAAEFSRAALNRALANRAGGSVGSVAAGSGAPNRGVPLQSEGLQAQLDLLLAHYTARHPDAIRLKEMIHRQRALEERAAADLPPAAEPVAPAGAPASERAAREDANVLGPSLPAPNLPELPHERERAMNLKTMLSLAAKEIESRAANNERILRDIAECQARIGRLPTREQEMAALTRDYEMSKAHYKSLLDKRFSARMGTDLERRQQAERFTVLDPARVPEKPVKPNRPALMAIFSALALILSCAAAYAREAQRNVLLGEWELPPDLAILGRVPRIAEERDRSAPGFGPPRPWWRTSRVMVPSAVLCFAAAVAGTILAWNRF